MLSFNALGGACTGNAGRPSPVVSVRIVDPDGHEVEPGETGEIVARGPQVMNGYRNRPDETARRQARRLAPHRRPGPTRGRRLAQLRGAQGPPHQVGGREHLPGRGRGRARGPPRGARGGRHRGARPHLGPVGAGRRGAGRRRGRGPHRGRADRARARRASPRTRSRARWWSATSPCPAWAGRSTTTRSTSSTAAAATPAAAESARAAGPGTRSRAAEAPPSVVAAGQLVVVAPDRGDRARRGRGTRSRSRPGRCGRHRSTSTTGSDARWRPRRSGGWPGLDEGADGRPAGVGPAHDVEPGLGREQVGPLGEPPVVAELAVLGHRAADAVDGGGRCGRGIGRAGGSAIPAA